MVDYRHEDITRSVVAGFVKAGACMLRGGQWWRVHNVMCDGTQVEFDLRGGHEQTTILMRAADTVCLLDEAKADQFRDMRRSQAEIRHHAIEHRAEEIRVGDVVHYNNDWWEVIANRHSDTNAIRFDPTVPGSTVEPANQGWVMLFLFQKVDGVLLGDAVRMTAEAWIPVRIEPIEDEEVEECESE